MRRTMLALWKWKQCQVPVTAESVNRRQMYRVDQVRKDVAQNFKDDYAAFLRHCGIRLTIRPLTEENLERVHELTQRTNQMNFSGNRYDRECSGRSCRLRFSIPTCFPARTGLAATGSWVSELSTIVSRE